MQLTLNQTPQQQVCVDFDCYATLVVDMNIHEHALKSFIKRKKELEDESSKSIEFPCGTVLNLGELNKPLIKKYEQLISKQSLLVNEVDLQDS